MIAFEAGQYSVPEHLVGQTVWVRVHGRGADEQVVIVHLGEQGPVEVARTCVATPRGAGHREGATLGPRRGPQDPAGRGGHRPRPVRARNQADRRWVPHGKTFDARQPELSSIPAPTQQALRTLEWVHRRENLVVCGPSGTGKTFLLEALGQHAVEQGLRVAWFTLEDLGRLLRRHRADDTATKAIARLLRADLVVVDDIGLLAVASDAAEGLYRLVDAAYEKRSIATSSRCA